jgi:hypothetical protein
VRIAVGSRVEVVERPALEAALFAGDSRQRPEPAQFEGAGRRAQVVSVRLAGREPLYALAGLPGWWREDWLRAV